MPSLIDLINIRSPKAKVAVDEQCVDEENVQPQAMRGVSAVPHTMNRIPYNLGGLD